MRLPACVACGPASRPTVTELLDMRDQGVPAGGGVVSTSVLLVSLGPAPQEGWRLVGQMAPPADR